MLLSPASDENKFFLIVSSIAVFVEAYGDFT